MSTKAAWIVNSSFGGGLVAGDLLDLGLRVEESARCCLTTQSSTKVYRNPECRATRQTLCASIASDGFLAIVPDPTICFARSVFEQVQTIDVAEGASVVYLDWLVSGRYARGERWAFQTYRNRLDIRDRGRLALRDSLLLSPDTGMDALVRRFDCFATVVLHGDVVRPDAQRILAEVNETPLSRDPSLVESASRTKYGMVLRVLGVRREDVANRIKERLDFLEAHLGRLPWDRKW